jgi:hypothetical protein
VAHQRPSLFSGLEVKVADLILNVPGSDGVKALFVGEPGFSVPMKFHPFYVVHVSQAAEARGDGGYNERTGVRYYRYDGYVSADVALSDIKNMSVPADRVVHVPSYDATKALIESALDALIEWGGPYGELEANPVTSEDGKELTVELLTDTIRVGLARRDNSVTNRGSFEFHIYTRRLT